MRWMLFSVIFFSLGSTIAQTFVEQLSYQTSDYVFSQDSSLVAAVNRGSINIFDTSSQELVLRLEPKLPLCNSALFHKESLVALCGHMLYQWKLAEDLASAELVLEQEINRPYIEYEDFIWRSDKIIDMYSIDLPESPDNGRTAIVLEEFYCCDASSNLRIWSLNSSRPDFEVGISEIHSALFQDWQLLELQSLAYNGLEITIGNLVHGESSTLEPSFVVPDELYYVTPQMQNELILLRAFQQSTKETHNWLFDLKSREEKTWLDDSNYVLSEEATWLAQRQDYKVSIWEARAFLTSESDLTDALLHFEFEDLIRSISFSKDESHLLVETVSDIKLFRLDQFASKSKPRLDLSLESPIPFHFSPIRPIHLSPNARYLFIVEQDQTFFIDVENQSEFIQNKTDVPELTGYFSGYAEQNNSELGWQSNLFLTSEKHIAGAAVAYVNYEPNYACTSKLLFQESQNGVMSFKEKLITGQGICVNDGSVTLEQTEDGLEWRFYKPDGSFDSSALLTRP